MISLLVCTRRKNVPFGWPKDIVNKNQDSCQLLNISEFISISLQTFSPAAKCRHIDEFVLSVMRGKSIEIHFSFRNFKILKNNDFNHLVS